MISKESLLCFLHARRVGNAKPPRFLKIRSSNTFIISTVSLAVFTDIFLYSVVVPILPFALTTRANVPENDVQRWTSIFLSVYGAALGIGSLVFGYFADKSTSRRMPLLLGLLALGGSTAMLCAGEGLPLLLSGRILQGLSASVVWTVGLAMLSDTIAKEDIGQAMGYIAMAYSVASVAGPLLGGVVFDHAGYYAVFAMGFAIITFDILLRLLMIEKAVAEQWVSTNDAAQVETSDAGTPSSSDIQPNPIDDCSQNEKISSEQPESSSGSTLMQRLPPIITLLRLPRLLAALFGCFVQATSLTAFEAVLPIHVKNTFQWTSTGAGLIFTCLVVPALFSPLVGHISDRCGSRVITTIGFFGAVPFWVLLHLITYNSIRQKVLLGALLTIIGSCLTLVASPLMAEIDHTLVVEERRRPGSLGERGAAAQGFGLFNFAFACGSLVGPLWAGFVAESAGWGTMGWTLGLLNGVGALVTLVWTGGRIRLRGRRADEATV